MAIQKSKHALGQIPVASLHAALVAGLLFEHVTTAPLAAGDIIQMGPLEAGVKPVDVALITGDLDTNGAPAITLTVGILNAAGTDIDAAATSTWIANSNAGQTGGIARATTANVMLSGRASVTRQLGVKVVTGPATAAPAGVPVNLLVHAQG